MSKKQHRQNKTPNKQEQLKNAIAPVNDENMNRSHNVKKEALGPNTKR